ncbi:SUMF1/EgtB/PvdO family nonheme iron enzyme [Streptomyces sp. DSM 44917]|uniref:SUMF1/EgtB/PvdO family nonheme iron enzyme n=1 Tax=Streptomyces boetiae TaxID=3075541 RepID=A0ABU2L7U4_9ACTN|nr:SUMF1/EgtB/PvdO family nonheme iron enzyme [Streptomyces sp. DSM 44917]MDT0307649.1 SUMF1/EgtB/PvdO family nonheme iron enzyme [Streptomyces sp. DSM 44917]
MLGSEPSLPPGNVPAARDTTRLATAADLVQWAFVPGGDLPAGEWHRAQTVAGLWWTDAPLTAGGYPLTGLTLDQATEMAARLGGRIPTSAEWEWMAGAGLRRFPWGDERPTASRSNLRGLGPGRPNRVRRLAAGRTPHGLWDVAGNVWEWTRAPGRRDGIALLRGGSYNSLPQYASCSYANDVLPDLTSPGIGVRLVRDTPPPAPGPTGDDG